MKKQMLRNLEICCVQNLPADIETAASCSAAHALR
jgi:hypothetical protein